MNTVIKTIASIFFGSLYFLQPQNSELIRHPYLESTNILSTQKISGRFFHSKNEKILLVCQVDNKKNSNEGSTDSQAQLRQEAAEAAERRIQEEAEAKAAEASKDKTDHPGSTDKKNGDGGGGPAGGPGAVQNA